MATRFNPAGYKPELAVELRRVGYGNQGERLGLDAYELIYAALGA
jgi:hypothetical protein